MAVDTPESSTDARADDGGLRYLSPGAIVGEYEIESLLGEGGMGAVYAAVHPVLGRKAAVKILRREFSSTPAAVQRFVQEAQLVNRVRHRNIVDIFGFGETAEGQHYCVMELHAGETLGDRLRAGPVASNDALLIIRQLVAGLRAAHDQRILHRDLKPGNIFLGVDDDGEILVKILDFGIAKLMVGATNRAVGQGPTTQTGVVMGTPGFISPEQARSQSVGPQSDVYALGALAFELLTGTPPFSATSTMDLLMLHVAQPAPRPSTLVSGLPDALDALVHAMLAKDPTERPLLSEASVVLEECTVIGDTVRRVPSQTAERSTVVLPPAAESKASPHLLFGPEDFDPAVAELDKSGDARPILSPLEGNAAVEPSAAPATTSNDPTADTVVRAVTAVAKLRASTFLPLDSADGPDEASEPTSGQGDDDQRLLTDRIVPTLRPARRSRRTYLLATLGVLPLLLVALWAVTAAEQAPATTTATGNGAFAANVGQRADANAAADPDTSTRVAAADKPASTRSRSRKHSKAMPSFGYVTVNARPWVTVFIDGRRVAAETPLRRYRLSAGKHRFRFENAAAKFERTRVFTITANRTSEIFVDTKNKQIRLEPPS